MKIKQYTKVIIMFSVLMLCLGCQNNESKNIIVPQDEETINLSFFGYKSEAINVVAIEETLQNYMKDHPHVQISYESVKGTDYYDVLSKRLNNDNVDDIFMIDKEHLQKFKRSGYFEDLSNLSTIPNFSQRSLEQMKEEDGRIYYVPSTISAFGLYCNLDLLKEHHQDIPKNEEEFMKVCQYFVDQGITPLVANNDISLKTIAIAKGLYPLYQKENYREIIQKMNNDSQILKDYMRPGYELVEKIIQNKFVDAKETLKTQKNQDDLTQFSQGENPFMLTGAWAAIRVEKMAPELNFEVHPYPILSDGEVLVTNIDTRLCVNAKGKHVEEAKKFIEYMTQTEEMWKFVDNQCSFSPLNNNQLSTNKAVQPLNKYLNDQQSILGSNQLIDYEMWSNTRAGVQLLLQGETVEAALDLINKER